MPKLVLLRHGESVWNRKNIFTGWVDVSLSPEGIEEAIKAGEKIADIEFDVVFTSDLIRAQLTAVLALSKNQKKTCPVMIHQRGDQVSKYALPRTIGEETILPIFASEALNERHYGDLQGKNKQEIEESVGKEQFLLWRRSFATPPPNGESLKDTIERAMPYFQEKILPMLIQGKTVLISAHGNSLRGIVKDLESISDEEIVSLEIPTGQPIVYQYEEGMWSKVGIN